MSYSVQSIANQFIDLAWSEGKGAELTNMKLQKLVFLAHGFHLGATGNPLTYNDVKAWNFGPVFPRLYKNLQQYGRGVVDEQLVVPEKDRENDIKEDENAMAAIRAVWKGFGNLSGGQLSTLTHQKGSPWDRTWNEAKFSVISNEVIENYYREMLNNA